MTDPELLFDQTEEYQQLQKTHDVLTYFMWVIMALFLGSLLIPVVMP